MGQAFRTIPVPNDNFVLYALSIRAPGAARTAVQTYTFPLSPRALRKDYDAMTAMYHTQGAPNQRGVARSFDRYGSTPPLYSLEGTTGWQRHSTDAFLYTGMQSIANLQKLFSTYDQLNAKQTQANISDLYTLEFYDYFANEYWQVEPIGRQGVSQDASRPLYFNYSFRWAAGKAVSEPIAPALDLLAVQFAISPASAASLLLGAVTGMVTDYVSQTAGALLQSSDNYVSTIAGSLL